MPRTIEQINSDLAWVSSRLNDSQEHAQIVRLEERQKELWAELKAVKTAMPQTLPMPCITYTSEGPVEGTIDLNFVPEPTFTADDIAAAEKRGRREGLELAAKISDEWPRISKGTAAAIRAAMEG